jgi:hypothetical protein
VPNVLSLYAGSILHPLSLPYRLYINTQKKKLLPCGVTARTKNIYLFWGCGIEKRGFLAYFGACLAQSLCGVGVN